MGEHTLSSPCTTLLAARVPPRQVPWPVTAEAVSTSLQKALRVVFMLTMFGARGHYNGIGLAPGRPGRPVVTAMGGAGRSFGIYRAMLQHVNLGAREPTGLVWPARASRTKFGVCWPCTAGVATIVELASTAVFPDVPLPLWGGFWFVL